MEFSRERLEKYVFVGRWINLCPLSRGMRKIAFNLVCVTMHFHAGSVTVDKEKIIAND